jgi:hypothetical protein
MEMRCEEEYVAVEKSINARAYLKVWAFSSHPL